MIDKRPALLLKHLLKVKHTTMNQVMEHSQLTKRQISYDLDKINYWLKERALPAIPYKGMNHIMVPEEVMAFCRKQQLENRKQDFFLTEEERLIFIYLYLFIRQEHISSVHLTQLLQVSKNTVISDVKKANEMNRPFLVEIRYSRQKGYHLRGTESDKRILVQQHLAQMMQIPYFEKLIHYLVRDRQELLPLDSAHRALVQAEKLFQLDFVEERVRQFAYFLVLYAYRHKEGKSVQFHSDEIELLSRDPMWPVAKTLFDHLGFEEDEHELCYFTTQLLGLSLGSRAVQEGSRDLLFHLCEQLVVDFEYKAAIVFEQKDEVIRTLYQHFKPAYFRMKYRIPIHNPLLEQIQKEHHELYTIIKELLQPVGSLLSINIPEEEIGFITMHFGALLAKPQHAMPKKKRAIVVCPSGVSSSLMVKHQIESLFSEITVEKTLSLQEYQTENDDPYDLIFSTIELESKLPCFYVKPIMTPNEKNRLVNEVYRQLFGIGYQDLSLKELIQTIGRYADIFDEKGLTDALSQLTFHRKIDIQRRSQPVLNDLLKEETIQVVDQLSDWEEAIKVAANPLLEKGAIESSYIEAMIANIKTMGPYVVLGNEVAIPHARPKMGVNQVGMSFLKLNRPVYFLNDEKYPVRLLFCVAANDNKTHLKALTQLTKLLSDTKNIELLKEEASIEAFLDLFKLYSAAV
ncbi:BglG family transcription antiterminator [Paenibacillus macerans]|uniref:BglG family transcription antiterminator n=1 Tax=Paenibacillus macerans TaxID=44252 RepID=UPI002DBB04E0|nr:BglG family transcription antiterminator [Paenibacillus macerans]MEC0328509.1 BglG family transcription antiterminator [Paenibacillus macerans]